MPALEFVVVIGLVVLACSAAAGRLGVAPPALLLGTGVVLGLIPVVGEVHLPPEVMLLLFLPALLYWESLTTSLQEIRRNLRGVLLASTLLVVATAAALAVVGHALGLSWPAAWVLGAALAPTDATAVGALARSLPRRNMMVLRAESLINDGTALVVYAVAVGIAVGQQQWDPVAVGGMVLLSYVGGIAAGLLTAWLAIRVRRLVDDPVQDNVVTLLTPFTAFLLAEVISASGVLAVVVSGLVMTQAAPRIGRAAARHQTRVFWGLATFLLNAALFVLIGVELPTAVGALSGTDLVRGVIGVVVMVLVAAAVRFGFLVVFAYAFRLFDRRPEQRRRRVSNRSRVVSTVAGFRGAVSLAVALSVPDTIGSGALFPGRDLIVFVAAGVIVTTVVVQGLALPAVVRWARLPADSAHAERRGAEGTASEQALAELPAIAAELGTPPDVLTRVREEFTDHLAAGAPDQPAGRHEQAYAELRLALIASKRETVVRMRDQRRIDDSVLLAIQERLDTEELRHARVVADAEDHPEPS